MMPQRRSVVLLVVSALLFIGWISWLGYLALTATRPIVLSRPQFLVSEVDVEAELTGSAAHPDESVRITTVLWPTQGSSLRAEQTIVVSNLARLGPADGWSGPGRYLLPLVKGEGESYRIAPIPRSPGFSGRYDHPRIYRATPQTREQHQQIRSE